MSDPLDPKCLNAYTKSLIQMEPPEPQTCVRCNAPLPESHGSEPICSACLLTAIYGPDTEPSSDQPSIEELFPELEILEKLGEGGMGIVYLAKQPALDRQIALKMISPELSRDPMFVTRFHREARAMARLLHPGVVTIHDFGERGESAFILMEYVGGGDLKSQILKGPIPPKAAIHYMTDLCNAIDYAHQKGVTHRDLKPANILIDLNGSAKISDFGLSLLRDDPEKVPLTAEDYQMGTPLYKSPHIDDPEQSDIYALAVIFYEMITGRLPTGDFPSPSTIDRKIHPRVDRAIRRALSHDPTRRFSNALDFHRNIHHVVRRSLPAWFLAALAIAAVLLTALFVFLNSDVSTTAEAPPPVKVEQEVHFHPDFASQLASGGRIRSWTSTPRPLDLTPLEEFSDFVSLKGPPSWAARRKSGETYRDNGILTAEPIAALTRSYTLYESGTLIKAENRRDLDLPLFREDQKIKDIAASQHTGIALTEDGSVLISTAESFENRVINRFRWERMKEEIAAKKHVRMVSEFNGNTALLSWDGTFLNWNPEHGFRDGAGGAQDLVQLECGVYHTIGLRAGGDIVSWGYEINPRLVERLQPVIAVPENDGPFVRVKAFSFMSFAQRQDGSWLAWGDDWDSGALSIINEMGPAIDLHVEAFSDGVRLIWIEPIE